MLLRDTWLPTPHLCEFDRRIHGVLVSARFRVPLGLIETHVQLNEQMVTVSDAVLKGLAP